MDISNPSDPGEIGSDDTPGCAYKVAIADGTFVITTRLAGVIMLEYIGVKADSYTGKPIDQNDP